MNDFLHSASACVDGFERPVQVAMTHLGALLILESFMVMLAEASACVAVKQHTALDGWTCQPFSHKDIANVPYHHCLLACIQRQECQAFIYDREGKLCMMLSKPCTWIRPYIGHIYGISKPLFVSWEHHDKDFPFYRYYERNNRRSYVGWRLHQGGMLIGKVTSGFVTVDPNTFSIVSGGSYDILVVDSFCEVTWVPHDAYSDHLLPLNALIGGVLSTTHTPLYVARQLIDAKLIVG